MKLEDHHGRSDGQVVRTDADGEQESQRPQDLALPSVPQRLGRWGNQADQSDNDYPGGEDIPDEVHRFR